MNRKTLRHLTLLGALAATAAIAAGDGYPPAPRGDAADDFHGVRVEDPYRWLEDLEAPRTRSWAKAQDELTARRLESGPAFEGHHRRLREIVDFERYPRVVARGSRHFVLRLSGGGFTDPVYFVREDGAMRPLLDAKKLPGRRTLTSLFSPDPDGRLVAYGSAATGSQWNRVRILDVASGEHLGEELAGIHSRYGTLGWTSDGSGFYYTGFEPEDELRARPLGARILFHRAGTPQSEDVVVHEAPGEEDRWFQPRVTDDGRFLVVRTSRAGWAGQQIYYADLEDESAKLRPLVTATESMFGFVGNDGPLFYLHTQAGAPNGRLVGVDVRRPQEEHWTEILPEGEDPIRFVNLAAGRLIASYVHDGRPQVFLFDLEGKLERELPLPGGGMTWRGFLGRHTDREAFFSISSLADPGTLYRLDPKTGTTEIYLRPDLNFNPDDFVLRQVKYTGRDGTRVPMFLAHKKGLAMSPKNPVFLYGYGAFAWSAFPWFQPQIVAWMEEGGIYALPGVRGGGEYGESWHQAGTRANKQTTIDDYLAAAEYLIEKRYTSPRLLVANGGSASGVLAGAALVKRPELFGAVTIDIPTLDMLRFETLPRGQYWVPEYGSVKDPEEFRALFSYSPYHNLKPGTCYPATLLTAGELDQTTVPSHAYKFTAAMQAAQGCENPVLLQVVWGAGHTYGTTAEQSARTWARQLAFLDAALAEPELLDPATGRSR